jgi:hypothetical protein
LEPFYFIVLDRCDTNNKSSSFHLSKSLDNSLMHLKEKISVNFISDLYVEVLQKYDIFWNDKSLVEQYIRSNFEQYESQLYAVLDQIRTGFQNHVGNLNKSVHAAVQEPIVFKSLSELLLDPAKHSDPRYQKVALVLVLFFFEYCDIGKKTADDPITLFPKYNNNYDSSN